MTYRIGDRANNGRYDLIEPSGARIPGKGIKAFNAKINSGDPVKVFRRQDGLYLILGPNAPPQNNQPNPLGMPALKDNCGGYLVGQVFNCGGAEKEIISAWALGTFALPGGNIGVSLINLVSGETYFLTSIPGTIQPCTPNNPPPGPPPPEPPPTQGDDRTYIHVWVQPTNFLPAWQPPHCSIGAPVPLRSDTVVSNTTIINLVNPIDGTSWFFRNTVGVYSDLPSGDPGSGWGSSTVSMLSNDPTPPAKPIDVAFPVTSTGYTDYNNSAFLTPILSGNESTWIYASTACIPSPYDPNTNPGPNPNYNRQPPPATPIANQYEMTLSLDTVGNPISFIRHSPSCVNQGDWSFRRSYRVIGGQIRNYLGKLLEDWRYTVPSFTCQSNFATDTFTNLAPEISQLWFIETGDRPATISTNAAAVTIPIKNRGINLSDCSTTDIKTLNVQGQAIEPGTRTYQITSIGVRARKQKI
jgi:hypothetical protein